MFLPSNSRLQKQNWGHLCKTKSQRSGEAFTLRQIYGNVFSTVHLLFCFLFYHYFFIPLSLFLVPALMQQESLRPSCTSTLLPHIGTDIIPRARQLWVLFDSQTNRSKVQSNRRHSSAAHTHIHRKNTHSFSPLACCGSSAPFMASCLPCSPD